MRIFLVHVREGIMITLKQEEFEKMCSELDGYFQHAEQALCANLIKTHTDARVFASTINQANAILTAVMNDEIKRGENSERVKKMENLSEIATRLHGRAKELSISLDQ